MSSLAIDTDNLITSRVYVTENTLTVDLEDGRTITVPIEWFPRLVHATVDERADWRLIGHGEGIHWPALDEDISVAGLLVGIPSRESQQSLKRWLAARAGEQSA